MKKVREYMEANKQAIIDDYLSGFGGWDLYLKYNVSGGCIAKYLRKWGISIRTSSETKALSKLKGKPILPEIENEEIVSVEEPVEIVELPVIIEPLKRFEEVGKMDNDLIKTLQRSRKYKKRKGTAWSKIKHSPELREKQKVLKQHVNRLKRRCGLCGETNSDMLLFHHIDPSIKSDEISDMVKRLMPMYQIRAEITKCVVVCFNCHHIIHRKEFADIFDDYKEAMG